jgi:hypothetical protein
MTWLNGCRIRLMLVVFVVGIMLFGGSARADFTFGKPTNLGPTVNSEYGECGSCISADGLSLYFDCDRPGGGGDDIWVVGRLTKDEVWGTPVNLGPTVNSAQADWDPCISYDGLELYFRSNRPGGYGSSDIWVTKRITKEEDWDVPMNLGNMVNTSSYEDGPCLSADGLSLFFDSYQRAGGNGHWDMWVTTRESTSEPWGQPVNLGPELNSPARDTLSTISADGLFLCFSSERSGGYGSTDIWITTRATTTSPWNPCINAGPSINTPYGEIAPWISSDGTTLYFGDWPSPRPGGYGGEDLWQAPILPTVDFTGNGQVDIDDLLILIEHWGQNEPAFDMGPMPWGDGVIDEADLEILMSYWGQDIYDPHLLAHWKLDETEADVAYDSAGVNDTTLIWDATWEPENGKIDGALQLDGADDYIQTSYILDPGHGSLTALLWIKGGVPGQVILSQEDGANWLMIDTEGRLATEFKLPGMSMPFVSGAVITDGDWHRIGVVWDGTNRLLYVDGVQVLNESGIRFRPSQGGLHIGAGSDLEPATFFSGMIDDVRIYDRVVAP